MLLLNLTRMRALTPTLPAYAAAFTRPTPTGDQDVLNAWLNDHTNQVPISPRAPECRLDVFTSSHVAFTHTYTAHTLISHREQVYRLPCELNRRDYRFNHYEPDFMCAPPSHLPPHPLICCPTLSSAAPIPSYRRCRTPPPTLGDSNSTPKLPPHAPTTDHNPPPRAPQVLLSLPLSHVDRARSAPRQREGL